MDYQLRVIPGGIAQRQRKLGPDNLTGVRKSQPVSGGVLRGSRGFGGLRRCGEVRKQRQLLGSWPGAGHRDSPVGLDVPPDFRWTYAGLRAGSTCWTLQRGSQAETSTARVQVAPVSGLFSRPCTGISPGLSCRVLTLEWLMDGLMRLPACTTRGRAAPAPSLMCGQQKPDGGPNRLT